MHASQVHHGRVVPPHVTSTLAPLANSKFRITPISMCVLFFGGCSTFTQVCVSARFWGRVKMRGCGPAGLTGDYGLVEMSNSHLITMTDIVRTIAPHTFQWVVRTAPHFHSVLDPPRSPAPPRPTFSPDPRFCDYASTLIRSFLILKSVAAHVDIDQRHPLLLLC